MYTVICSALLYSLLFNWNGILGNEWHVAKENDGITISTRKMEDTGYKQIKAEMIVDASLATCVALIEDSQVATDWIHRMEEFRTLTQESDSVWYTYGLVSIPWPFKDKDLVSKNRILKDSTAGSVTIFSESVPDYVDEIEEYKRIKQSTGRWTFIPQQDGSSKVVYSIFAEANDFLPAWIVNQVVVGSVYSTFTSMREILIKRQAETSNRL